jgi:hypothetical protein
MKTYGDWIVAGRAVKRGERARFYATEPNGERRIALFEEEQTEPYDPVDLTGWPIVAGEALPSSEKKPRAKPTPSRRLKVSRTQDGSVAVWCGPDTRITALLQRKDWFFNRKTCRWIAPHQDLEKTVAGFESIGYECEVTP